ncbi:MAG: hypothetical protein L0Z68_00350 [Gammaproteobacteria bacterium]|nr:hypothetical protein [Gammaproteobacteria bacterium]
MQISILSLMVAMGELDRFDGSESAHAQHALTGEAEIGEDPVNRRPAERASRGWLALALKQSRIA